MAKFLEAIRGQRTQPHGGESTVSQGERVKKRKKKLATAATILLAAPGFVAAMGSTGDGGNGSGGGGSSSSISILGYPVRSDYLSAFDAAGRVCPSYTEPIAVSQAYTESGDGRNNGPVQASDGTTHEGPAMFNPKSKLWADNAGGTDIWSPDAIVVMAKVVCGYMRRHSWDLGTALNAYFAGEGNPARGGSYGSDIINRASTVRITHRSGGGGSRPHKKHLSNGQKAAELRHAGYSHVSVHGKEGKGTFGRGCPTVIFTMKPEGGFTVHGLVTNESNKVRWPGNANPSAQEMRGLDGRLCH